jgi:hypothetical protein
MDLGDGKVAAGLAAASASVCLAPELRNGYFSSSTHSIGLLAGSFSFRRSPDAERLIL